MRFLDSPLAYASGLTRLLVAATLMATTTATPETARAARTVLFETFEDETPGDSALAGQIESLDYYGRSSVSTPDAADALISGAAIPDPFAPGNKSLILYNPTGTSQMTANFFDCFDADPTQFRNGVIEFDVYMEAAQPGSYWTFFDIRFGFDTTNPTTVPRVVTTTEDETIWNAFRMQEGGLQGGGAAPDIFYDYTTAATYADQNVVAPDRKLHVRYDINGSNSTYTVSIDNLENADAPVDVIWPGENPKPWETTFNFITFQDEPAPGINVIAFLTDASANGLSRISQSVFIDNLRVINNDLPPLASADFDSDGDTDGADFLTFQRNSGTTTGATLATGDADGDGAVNASDLAIFKASFGSAVAVAAAVPEPTAIVLAAVCLAALASRRGGRLK